MTEDKYILDEENAIIVVENNDKETHPEYYIIIHQRLVDGKLIEVNRWYMNGYYFGAIKNETVIKELSLFKVQNGKGWFNA